MTRYTCDECRYSGGWHDDPNSPPDEPPPQVRCPNYVRAMQEKHIAEMAEDEKSAATEAARRIVKDAAERFVEFSANQLRDEINAAQIVSSGAMGQAFTWAKNQGLIEWTGRMVPSNDPGTHGHRVFVWRSLADKWRRGAA